MDIFGKRRRAIDSVLAEADFPVKCRRCRFPRTIAETIIANQSAQATYADFVKEQEAEGQGAPAKVTEGEVLNQTGRELRWHAVLGNMAAEAEAYCPGYNRRNGQCEDYERAFELVKSAAREGNQP